MSAPTSSPETVVLRVETESCPCRLDAYLAGALSDLSRSRLKTLIIEGRARVDGKHVKPRLALQGGEEIVVELPQIAPARPEPQDIPLEILYEDNDLMVINKPSGMVVHPGAGVPDGTLVNAILAHCPDLAGVGGEVRPGIVHRLDRLTSGCLVVAKNDIAHRHLSDQLSRHEMSRVYLAWVNGQIVERQGRIEASIGRSARHRTRMTVTQRGGRHAATQWKILGRAPGLTRVECRLETGRTHQIRVHMAYINHPVAGDPEYGLSPRDARMLIPPGHPRIIQALSRCRRQMLHAQRVEFVHPRSEERMAFQSEPPEDFLEFDRALEPYTEPPAGEHEPFST